MQVDVLNQLLNRKPTERLLIYGIGNVARQDDGLGIRFIEKLEDFSLPIEVSLEANYQLNVEDALLISNFEVVLFVDATSEVGAKVPFSIRRLEPTSGLEFSTHAMTPEAILSLCDELYGKQPRAFLLALPGFSWSIGEELSAKAVNHFRETFHLLFEAVGKV